MFFGFDDDQIALRDAVAAFLEKRAGLPVLQAAWTSPDGALALWPELAGMGVHGLMAPEAAGGSAFDWVTMALVLAETGIVALPLPLLETAGIGVPALVAAGDPLGVVPSLVDGSAMLTASSEVAAPVPFAEHADLILLGDTLYRRGEVEVEAIDSVDRTRHAGRVRPLGGGVRLDGVDVEAMGALATAAVLVGLGRALVRMTVDYVKDRKQFGVPVGSFQAVKHHLADATMRVEFAAPAVWAAAWEMSSTVATVEGRSRSVSLAKALASDGASQAARAALQCHGAMGYTDDYHLHFWLKRVWCLVPSYGTAREHRARVGSLLGLSR